MLPISADPYLRKGSSSLKDVQLKLLDHSNWQDALKIRTGAGQLQFVADYEPVALVILAKSYVRHGGYDWKPFGIFENDQMVGVFTLAHSPTTCVLFHLLIDAKHQGRGLGRSAMLTIIEYVKASMPELPVLTLTTNPLNKVAKRLYESLGFVVVHRPPGAEEVFQLKLHG